ncbi:MAG: hypothetical protein WDM89_11475 [Rhizomicrobium sp.]
MPSIFPIKNGLAYAIGFWSDRLFFLPSVGVVFGEIGHLVPEEFKQDRAKMSGSTFSTEAMAAAAPFAKDHGARTPIMWSRRSKTAAIIWAAEAGRGGHPCLYEFLVGQSGVAAHRRNDDAGISEDRRLGRSDRSPRPRQTRRR